MTQFPPQSPVVVTPPSLLFPSSSLNREILIAFLLAFYYHLLEVAGLLSHFPTAGRLDRKISQGALMSPLLTCRHKTQVWPTKLSLPGNKIMGQMKQRQKKNKVDSSGTGDQGLAPWAILVPMLSETWFGDFSGGPVVKMPHSQCRGPRVQFLVGKLDPTCHNHKTGKKKSPKPHEDPTCCN